MNEKVKKLMAEGYGLRTAYRIAKLCGRQVNPEVQNLMEQGMSKRTAYRNVNKPHRKSTATSDGDGYVYRKGKFV